MSDKKQDSIPEKLPTRTYFHKSLRGDRIAVVGVIIGILTLPFVWWLGLVFTALGFLWIGWSFKDWRDAEENNQSIWQFLREAIWDAYQYEIIPKELKPIEEERIEIQKGLIGKSQTIVTKSNSSNTDVVPSSIKQPVELAEREEPKKKAEIEILFDKDSRKYLKEWLSLIHI